MSKKKAVTGLKMRGFLRGQIVDRESGKVIGDTGWRQNKATNDGLKNLALLITGGGYSVGYAAIGTQTDAIDMTQTDLIGSVNSFQAVSTSTSGTCTATYTCSFAGTNLAASATIGAAGLYKTNSAGSMVAAAIFTTSQMTTAQDFNLTYQLRFATA